MWNRFDFIRAEWELCKIARSTGVRSTGVRSRGNNLLRRTWRWQGRTGTHQRRTVGTGRPGAERWGAAWVYQWSYWESCLPPPCGSQSLSHQCHSRVGLQLHTALLCPGSGSTDLGQPAEPSAWGQQNHPAAQFLRSCLSRTLRGAVSSLSPYSCSLHQVPSSAWFPGHSHWHQWQRGPAGHKPHTRKVPCCSSPCCCVYIQETVLTWRKWQLPKYSLKKLQELESIK